MVLFFTHIPETLPPENAYSFLFSNALGVTMAKLVKKAVCGWALLLPLCLFYSRG